jgi:hypothetical protein
MSLPVEDMASAGAAITGCDLTPPDKSLILTPQRPHAAAGHLAKTAPEIIAHPDAARGLEQALVEAMMACLTTAAPNRSVLAAPPRTDHAGSQVGGGAPRSTTLSTGDLQGHTGAGQKFAAVLSGAPRDKPETISAGMPRVPGAPGLEQNFARLSPDMGSGGSGISPRHIGRYSVNCRLHVKRLPDQHRDADAVATRTV